jgi:hypothetical protein
MVRFFLALAVASLMATLASGQNEGPIRASLSPAGLPSTALKYRLLPELRDQTAGNAAPLYKEAEAKLKPLQREFDERAKWQTLFPEWANTPLKEFPRDEVRKALEPYKEILELTDKAARRQYCDWDLLQRIRERGFETLLPEVQDLRSLASLLSVAARLQMADGDFVGALRTLQTGLSLARQTGEQPTVINELVGWAIAAIMLRQIDDFVQQPGAPNLYWALTDLRRPLIDPHKGFDGLRMMMHAAFPGIAEAMSDPNAAPLTEEQVRTCVRLLVGQEAFADIVKRLRRDLEISQIAAGHYEENKKALIEAGRPKDKVEAMPHIEVALLVELNRYESLLDQQLRWQNEPYYQIADKLDQQAKVLQAPATRRSMLPEEAFTFTATSVGKVFKANARAQRKLDMLRCVEAIRAYAAAHDGKLPTALTDVKEVPIPLDVVTGKPFAYTVNGAQATLEAPAVNKDVKPDFQAVVYEITVARK